LPALLDNGAVVVGSVAGDASGIHGLSATRGASKRAVIGLTRSVALEIAAQECAHCCQWRSAQPIPDCLATHQNHYEIRSMLYRR
jgi:hypothetical protein